MNELDIAAWRALDFGNTTTSSLLSNVTECAATAGKGEGDFEKPGASSHDTAASHCKATVKE